MKTIYLSDGDGGWKHIQYENIDDLTDEFSKRNIKIDDDVTINDNVKIGNNVIIESNVEIGNDVVIADSVRFGNFARFGDGVRDKPNTTYIGRGCSFETGCTICLSVNIGENNVFGKYVFIANDTIIGNNCTFKGYSEIGYDKKLPIGIKIENNVTIGLGVYLDDNIIIRNNATVTDYCSIGNMEGGSEVEEGEVVNRYNVRYF